MISLKQKRILVLVVIVVTLVNLGAVGTVLYKLQQFTKNNKTPVLQEPQPGIKSDAGPAFLMREIDFDAVQQESMLQSRLAFRNIVAPTLDELRELNADLAEEVMSVEPDTAKLRRLCYQIGGLHASMKMETMHHLLDIKQIATPEQNEKLNFFYQEMLSRGDGAQADGKGHRHRWGRRKAQPNNAN